MPRTNLSKPIKTVDPALALPQKNDMESTGERVVFSELQWQKPTTELLEEYLSSMMMLDLEELTTVVYAETIRLLNEQEPMAFDHMDAAKTCNLEGCTGAEWGPGAWECLDITAILDSEHFIIPECLDSTGGMLDSADFERILKTPDQELLEQMDNTVGISHAEECTEECMAAEQWSAPAAFEQVYTTEASEQESPDPCDDLVSSAVSTREMLRQSDMERMDKPMPDDHPVSALELLFAAVTWAREMPFQEPIEFDQTDGGVETSNLEECMAAEQWSAPAAFEQVYTTEASEQGSPDPCDDLVSSAVSTREMPRQSDMERMDKPMPDDHSVSDLELLFAAVTRAREMPFQEPIEFDQTDGGVATSNLEECTAAFEEECSEFKWEYMALQQKSKEFESQCAALEQKRVLLERRRAELDDRRYWKEHKELLESECQMVDRSDLKELRSLPDDLYARGTDRSVIVRHFCYLFSIALLCNRFEVVNLFLSEQGWVKMVPDLLNSTVNDQSILHLAVAQFVSLGEKYCQVDQKSKNQILYEPCLFQVVQVVFKLIEAGADIHRSDATGQTPFRKLSVLGLKMKELARICAPREQQLKRFILSFVEAVFLAGQKPEQPHDLQDEGMNWFNALWKVVAGMQRRLSSLLLDPFSNSNHSFWDLCRGNDLKGLAKSVNQQCIQVQQWDLPGLCGMNIKYVTPHFFNQIMINAKKASEFLKEIKETTAERVADATDRHAHILRATSESTQGLSRGSANVTYGVAPLRAISFPSFYISVGDHLSQRGDSGLSTTPLEGRTKLRLK